MAEFNGYSYKQLVTSNERRCKFILNLRSIVLHVGLFYKYLIHFYYILDLNIYQIACKPRILEKTSNEQVRQDAESLQKGINELQKLGYAPEKLMEMVDTKLNSLDKNDDAFESEFVNLKLFDSIKEALLCSVCSDVFKDPLNVK